MMTISKTEEHIKDVARKLFFSEGQLNATTQEIADAAGVNRTLLNYYFRSRDALFQIVFDEAMLNFKTSLESIITQQYSVKERIENLVDYLLQEMGNNPYRELFFITQINQNEGGLKPKKEDETNKWRIFLEEIQSEIDAGNIRPLKPEDYVLNIFSMCILPVLMKPVYTTMFQISPEEYQVLLNNRKKSILAFIHI